MKNRLSIDQAMKAAREKFSRECLKRNIVKAMDSGYLPPIPHKEITNIVLTQTQMFEDSQINIINLN